MELSATLGPEPQADVHQRGAISYGCQVRPKKILRRSITFLQHLIQWPSAESSTPLSYQSPFLKSQTCSSRLVFPAKMFTLRCKGNNGYYVPQSVRLRLCSKEKGSKETGASPAQGSWPGSWLNSQSLGSQILNRKWRDPNPGRPQPSPSSQHCPPMLTAWSLRDLHSQRAQWSQQPNPLPCTTVEPEGE